MTRPTTTPEAKTWSISIVPRSFRSQQSNHVILKQTYPQLNRYHRLQFNAAFHGSTSQCKCDDVTMVDECKQSATTPSTHAKENFKVNTFHDGLKAWMDLYRHYVYPGSYLKYAFSIYKAKYDNRIGESPCRSWLYIIFIITHGLCSNDARFSMMTSPQSGSPIGRVGNSQTTHGSIVVEWRIDIWMNRIIFGSGAKTFYLQTNLHLLSTGPFGISCSRGEFE